jgi:hypothetical protein
MPKLSGYHSCFGFKSSRVQVPWDLWPYFTLSDLRLPFLLPVTTRRVTVEVFDLLRPYFTVSDLRLPFHRLLRLTGSWWRYSTLPPQGKGGGGCLMTSQHGQHRKHYSSVVACIFIAVGMCLLSHCLEMGTVYLPISWLLHSNSCTCCSILRQFVYCHKQKWLPLFFQSSYVIKHEVSGVVIWCIEPLHRWLTSVFCSCQWTGNDWEGSSHGLFQAVSLHSPEETK